MNFKTKKQAVKYWVDCFNQIPASVVEKLRRYEYMSVHESTPLVVGDYVGVYGGFSEGQKGYVEEVDINHGTCIVKFDDGSTDKVRDEFALKDDYDQLPMWSTLFAFNDWCDEKWLDFGNGRQIMAEIGFRLYESEDYGTIFGIDAAGCDFYELYWIPLYEARGLRWSEQDEADDDRE